MKTAVIEPAAVPLERSWTMADLAQLVKARLTFLVLVTTAVGFYAGWQGAMDFVALMHAVLGTALAAAGAAALNQWWEHKFDAIMVRTQMRPIPSGRMLPREGLIVGAALSVGGVITWRSPSISSVPFWLLRLLAFTSLLTRRSSESPRQTRWSARSPARCHR